MLKKVYNFVPDNAISNEQIIYKTMKILWKNLSVAIAAVSLISACSDSNNSSIPTPAIPKRGVTRNIEEKTQYASYIDWQTYAGDDFYRYATGAWQDATDLGDRRSKGTQQKQDNAENEFPKKVCEGGCPLLQKLFTQYKGAEDNNADRKKVKDKLADITSSVTTRAQAWQKIAQLMKEGYAMPFDYCAASNGRKIYPSLRANETVILAGENDLKQFASPEQRREIMAGAKKVWPAIGGGDDDDDEKRSAKRRRCVKEPLMPVSVCLTGTRAGGGADNTPVGQILRELGVRAEDVMITQGTLQNFNKNLQGATLEDIVNFMKYCVISRDRHFIAGTDPAKTIVRNLVDYDNTPLKLSLSRFFCESIDPKNRAAVKEMGEMLRQTFIKRIERNKWLDDVSKAGAKDKLKKMMIQVGWPDQWDENAEVKVKDDAGMNTYDLICDLFSQRASRTVATLAGKTDADHIFMTEMTDTPAWESNAFYSAGDNEVIVCASNLVPPIYDPSRDLIYNYALMGAPTLGHEITHGFDARGSKHDATGALREWMSPQSRATFNSLTGKVVKHFDGWEYYPGLQCDGEMTQRENTADMGGLCIAYEALMNQHQGSAAEKLYVAREYYRAFAYGWMEKGTPDYYRKYLTDKHAANSLRVNGTVREMDEFYEAFGITDGKLYLEPDERLHIW